MNKSEKGPVSQFLVEQLSELDTVHQYLQGHLNSVADAASRYPSLTRPQAFGSARIGSFRAGSSCPIAGPPSFRSECARSRWNVHVRYEDDGPGVGVW
jgi:hypothetical protein